MLNVDRTKAHCLAIGEHRGWPCLRLFILFVLVGLYYYALFASAGIHRTEESLPWMLLLFPLFLSPYLVSIWRTLRRRNEFSFDTVRQNVSQGGQPLVNFGDIDKILIVATNSTCEDLRLSLVLQSGRRVDLYEGPADNESYGLARELAGMLDLELETGTFPGVPGQAIPFNNNGRRT